MFKVINKRAKTWPSWAFIHFHGSLLRFSKRKLEFLSKEDPLSLSETAKNSFLSAYKIASKPKFFSTKINFRIPSLIAFNFSQTNNLNKRKKLDRLNLNKWKYFRWAGFFFGGKMFFLINKTEQEEDGKETKNFS
jgi:hypothetical protein